MSNPLIGVGIGKGETWVCKRCQKVNKVGILDCAQCGHEPTLGRRDVEAQKWADSHRREEDEQ